MSRVPVSGRVSKDPMIFNGASLNGFTASNQANNTSVQQNFTAGKTMYVALNITNTGSPAGFEVMLGCYRGTFAVGVGWRFFRWINGGGQPYLANGLGSAALLGSVVFTSGINILAIRWRASDNNITHSWNGGAATSDGTLTPNDADGTSVSVIGSLAAAESSWVNFATGGVVAYAILDREASNAELVAWTSPTSGSRFIVPDTILNDTYGCSVDFNSYRDWDGVAGTFATKGHACVTFTISGTLNKTDISEYRIPVDHTSADGKIEIAGAGYTQRNGYSNVQFQTNAILIGVEHFSTLYPTYSTVDVYGDSSVFAHYDSVGVFSNGTFQGLISSGLVTTKELKNYTLPAGSNKTIKLVDGIQGYPVTTPPAGGTFVQAFRVPVASGLTLIGPTPPDTRVVLIGDSIMSGTKVEEPHTQSQTALLRLTTSAGITCHAWGNAAIQLDYPTTAAADAAAAVIAAELDGITNNYLWMQLITNDYGNNLPITGFQTMYAYLLDAIHALKPTAHFYCQTAFRRISPASEATNSYGDLDAYRAAIATVVSTRTAFCHLVDGTTILPVQSIYNSISNPTGDYVVDGIHVSKVGAADAAAYMKIAMGL